MISTSASTRLLAAWQALYFLRIGEIMSLKNLRTITNNLSLVDTDAVFRQGYAAFMACFERSACPMKIERDRSIWLKGWETAREKFLTMTQRWREMDRGTERG